MRIGICHDREQFDPVMQPVEAALRRRGHEVVSYKRKPAATKLDAYVFTNFNGCTDKLQCPRIWLTHGISCLKPWVIPKHTDVWLAGAPYWVERGERKAVEQGVQCAFPLTGWSKTDDLRIMARHHAYNRCAVCQDLPLDPAKPLVVWLPTYNCKAKPTRDYKLEDVLVSLSACTDFQVVLAAHDLDKPKRLIDPRIKMQLLVAADCVLTDSSSVAFEALVRDDRPVVLLLNGARANSMHLECCADQPVPDFGTWTTPAGVVEAVQDALQAPLLKQPRRQWWRDYVLGPTDSLCTRRIVEEIERIVNER